MCAGRFGLGFNALYHVTDVPGFVTGDYIVMFGMRCRIEPAAAAAACMTKT